MPDLCYLPAVEQARLLRDGKLSAVELLEAHLTQIERFNPAVNAIVTLVPELARERAAAADRALAAGEDIGILHGLPIAHKDLALTAGIRTTQGSPIFADWVPEESSLFVERVRAAGAVTLGKTNTPEFGAGSQTFNAVFGATRNPYDLTKTCGGSSGGAAVALACGMVPLADGSDMGGSLRNPASFCNVVGFRPSPGRVPTWPSLDPWSPLSVEGPLGRTVADVALLLAAMAGPDARCPLSLPEPGLTFARPLERDVRGIRVAWSADAGGLPVEPAVKTALAPARAVLEELGCEVTDDYPDLSGAREIFQVLRAVAFETGLGPLYDDHRDELKETIRWNIELARRLSVVGRGERDPALDRASRARASLLRSLRLPRPADRPGTAVRARDGMAARGRRHSDGDLHRLDAQLLRYHRHRLPRDLRSRGLHAGRPARRGPARRSVP